MKKTTVLLLCVCTLLTALSGCGHAAAPKDEGKHGGGNSGALGVGVNIGGNVSIGGSANISDGNSGVADDVDEPEDMSGGVYGDGISLYPAYFEIPEGHSVYIDCETENDAEVEWSSSDPTVASVSADGEITALSPGTAAITARIKVSPASEVSCGMLVTETDENKKASNILTFWEYPPDEAILNRRTAEAYSSGVSKLSFAAANPAAPDNAPLSINLGRIPKGLTYPANAAEGVSLGNTGKKPQVKKRPVKKMLAQEKYAWSIHVDSTDSVTGILGEPGPWPNVREEWMLFLDVTKRNKYDMRAKYIKEYGDSLGADFINEVLPKGPLGTYVGRVRLVSYFDVMTGPNAGRKWMEEYYAPWPRPVEDPHPEDQCDMECIRHFESNSGYLHPSSDSNGAIYHEGGAAFGFKIINAAGYEYVSPPKSTRSNAAWCNEKQFYNDYDGPVCYWDWEFEHFKTEEYVDRSTGPEHADHSKKGQDEHKGSWDLNFYVEIFGGYEVIVTINNVYQREDISGFLMFLGELSRKLDDEDEWELDFSTLDGEDY